MENAKLHVKPFPGIPSGTHGRHLFRKARNKTLPPKKNTKKQKNTHTHKTTNKQKKHILAPITHFR